MNQSGEECFSKKRNSKERSLTVFLISVLVI